MTKKCNSEYYPYAVDPYNPTIEERVTIRDLTIAFLSVRYGYKTLCAACYDLGISSVSVRKLFLSTFGDLPRPRDFSGCDIDIETYNKMVRLGIITQINPV